MFISRVIDWLTGVIAVVAICGTGYALFRKEPDDARIGIVGVSESDWKIADRGGHIVGKTGATIIVVEFADFECPFCKSMEAALDSLRRLHPNVAVRFRHLPNSAIHPYATDAAVASECAAQQRGFAEYHDVLYKERALGKVGWTLLAARVDGIDTIAFKRCLITRAAAATQVAKDVADAQELHIEGTPAFFIGRRRINGAVPFNELVDAVKTESSGSLRR
jgi:protein-disulfide isomerase